MRFFEDLQVGEAWTFDGPVVDAAEAADFARRYDPEFIPPPGRGYIHRGPRISPWQAGALSWKLLSDLAATLPIEEVAFAKPAEPEWRFPVSAGDALRIEVELVELFPPSTMMREHGLALARVSLITTGAAGFGAWGDDDQERVDDLALTYLAQLTARRREPVSIYHGIA